MTTLNRYAASTPTLTSTDMFRVRFRSEREAPGRPHRVGVGPLGPPVPRGVVGVVLDPAVQIVLELLGLEVAAAGDAEGCFLTGEAVTAAGAGHTGAVTMLVRPVAVRLCFSGGRCFRRGHGRSSRPGVVTRVVLVVLRGVRHRRLPLYELTSIVTTIPASLCPGMVQIASYVPGLSSTSTTRVSPGLSRCRSCSSWAASAGMAKSCSTVPRFINWNRTTPALAFSGRGSNSNSRMTTPTTGACSSGAGEGACPPGPELRDAHPARSPASTASAHPAFHPENPRCSRTLLLPSVSDGPVPTVTHSPDRAIAPGRGMWSRPPSTPAHRRNGPRIHRMHYNPSCAKAEEESSDEDTRLGDALDCRARADRVGRDRRVRAGRGRRGRAGAPPGSGGGGGRAGPAGSRHPG